MSPSVSPPPQYVQWELLRRREAAIALAALVAVVMCALAFGIAFPFYMERRPQQGLLPLSPLAVLIVALAAPWLVLTLRYSWHLVRPRASVRLFPDAGMVRFSAMYARFWSPARENLDLPLLELTGTSAPRFEVRRYLTSVGKYATQVQVEELWLTPSFKMGVCSHGQAEILAAEANALLDRWIAEAQPVLPTHRDPLDGGADVRPLQNSAEPIYRASGREPREARIPEVLKYASAPLRVRIAALLFGVFAVAVFAFGVDCLRRGAIDRHPVIGVLAMLYALFVLFIATSVATGGVKLTIDPVAKTIAIRKRTWVFSRTSTFGLGRVSLARLRRLDLLVSPDIQCNLSGLGMTDERTRWLLPKIQAFFAGWSEALADAHSAEPSERSERAVSPEPAAPMAPTELVEPVEPAEPAEPLSGVEQRNAVPTPGDR